MDIRQIVPGFAVAPQIEPEELRELAAMGFRTIINNRPDSEIAPHFAHEAMAAAAVAAGLAYHHLPYVPGEMTADLIDAFAAVLAAAEAPVLAYCRTGTRSSHLWAMAEAPHRPLTKILAAAGGAGYDLAPMISLLRARGAR